MVLNSLSELVSWESVLGLCILIWCQNLARSAGEVTTTVVMGEVVLYHVLEAVVGKSPSGKTVVDINKLHPVVRMGGNFYGVLGQVSLDVPSRGVFRFLYHCLVE